MHRALTDPADPAFAPEPFDASRDSAFREMSARAEQVLELLAAQRDAIPESVQPQADAVLNAKATLLRRLEPVRDARAAGMRIRIHGDYHLGQVLRTEEDFVILDFEGEPGRSLPERRLKQSPLKDVAGMLRSFSYAAYAALFAFTINAPDDYTLLAPWADTWQQWVGKAFLSGYRGVAADDLTLPGNPEFDGLLNAFIIEKALYELGYELNNRPDWIRIPLAGILKAL